MSGGLYGVPSPAHQRPVARLNYRGNLRGRLRKIISQEHRIAKNKFGWQSARRVQNPCYTPIVKNKVDKAIDKMATLLQDALALLPTKERGQDLCFREGLHEFQESAQTFPILRLSGGGAQLQLAR